MSLRRRRPTPRRRGAPRWTGEEWAEATLRLYQRCNGTCWWCLYPLGDRGVRHHRQRRRDGGDTYANIILLHPDCHNVAPKSVHQEPRWATGRGFIVPTGLDPAQTPISIAAVTWVLDLDGGKRIFLG